MVKRFLLSVFIMFFSIISYCEGLEVATHKEINEYIARNFLNGFSLNSYLKNHLGIQKGINEDYISLKVWEWLRDGGEYEDVPAWYCPYIRSFNHYHNPLEPLYTAGYDGMEKSALIWAQMPVGQQFQCGNYSWHDVRQYYFWALTSTDLNTRNTYFSETFRGLGQLMHLVQDMSVPEHTRNDGHLLYNYEKWAKISINKDTIPNYQPVYFDNTSIGQPNPLASVPIANLFDTNQYTGSNPSDTIQNNVGLSEYANANFFSSDTIFKTGFPYPAWSSVVERDELDGAGRVKTYLKKIRDGEVVNRLAVGKWFYKYLSAGLKSNGLKLDETVYSDYAEKLIPRAVGYSAGLLNYFFRGEMSVSALPVFYNNNAIGHINAKIKNTTSTQEAMSKGYFVLMYRYTPTGAPADGSGDIFGYASNAVPVSNLLYGNELNATFDIYPQVILMANYNSLKFMLVFKGTLGAEDGAIIGKHFTLGDIRFNEDWDNGLTGNHTWGHTGYNFNNNNPSNGSTSNIITNGILFKDNIRNAGYSSARVNQSTVGLFLPSFNDIFPIPITAETYLQFKISRMDINPRPPDPPGTTSHWQNLTMYFNNNIRMQISTDQFVFSQSPTCYVAFDPNYIIVDNLYRIFTEICGMNVPQNLQLETIHFVQQISYTPDSQQYHQQMEVDFIRIIDMKHMQ